MSRDSDDDLDAMLDAAMDETNAAEARAVEHARQVAAERERAAKVLEDTVLHEVAEGAPEGGADMTQTLFALLQQMSSGLGSGADGGAGDERSEEEIATMSAGIRQMIAQLSRTTTDPEQRAKLDKMTTVMDRVDFYATAEGPAPGEADPCAAELQEMVKSLTVEAGLGNADFSATAAAAGPIPAGAASASSGASAGLPQTAVFDAIFDSFVDVRRRFESFFNDTAALAQTSSDDMERYRQQKARVDELLSLREQMATIEPETFVERLGALTQQIESLGAPPPQTVSYDE
jgi:hypothetical protein